MHFGIAFTKRIAPPAAGGQRWVIPDVHGCSQTLQALLDNIGLTKADQLFLLGDYINKGPDSKGVLDLLLQWQAQGYHIFCLRGNHEQIFLNVAQNLDLLRRVLATHHGLNLLDKHGRANPLHLAFISQMPYYFQLNDYYLVHAGLGFGKEAPLQDASSMLTLRNWNASSHQTEGRKVLHGHTPTELYFIEKNIELNSVLLPLDNGCVYAGEASGQGNLLAFNLETSRLIIQPNIDKKVKMRP